MTIREPTEGELPTLEELIAADLDEHWTRPFPPPPVPDSYFREGRVVVAEADCVRGVRGPLVDHVEAVEDAHPAVAVDDPAARVRERSLDAGGRVRADRGGGDEGECHYEDAAHGRSV